MDWPQMNWPWKRSLRQGRGWAGRPRSVLRPQAWLRGSSVTCCCWTGTACLGGVRAGDTRGSGCGTQQWSIPGSGVHMSKGAWRLHSCGVPAQGASNSPHRWISPPRVTLDEELPRRILHPDILKDIACHPGPLQSSKMTFLASVAFLSSAPLTSLLPSFSVSSWSPQTFSSAFASCLHAPPGDLCTGGFSALSAALTPSPQLLRLPTRHPTARATLPSDDVQQGPDVACPH